MEWNAAINDQILKMLIQDFQPFSFVEDGGFTSLMALACPDYQLHGRRYYTRRLKILEERLREKVQLEVPTVDGTVSSPTSPIPPSTSGWMSRRRPPPFLLVLY
eukprot:NODE_4936_length_748_cov_7.815451_g4133_i0.p2 GENE.NODE_4936_length_748_cov_7.815451_g4133_i0~~NODE_4936_length_748_cov_7.815451_g4133_i0.p2  ORF type:complete len:104 (+),score=17.72 NODE_4936_length_748_cov_7.815451_g4133_i0:385-696(+)